MRKRKYRQIWIGDEVYRIVKSEAAINGESFINYVNKKLRNGTEKKGKYDIKW